MRQKGLIYGSLVCMAIAAACNGRHKDAAVKVKHLATVPYSAGGELYVDGVANKKVLKERDSGNYTFSSFRIGFTDSLPHDKKEEIALNKYFDYEMQRDWVALVNGDTLRPVFVQPMVRKNVQSREALLVFEIMKGQQPDTLVYKSPFGPKEIQLIVLNRK